MGVIITPQKEIDAYFEDTRLSQSKLKTLLKGMTAYKAMVEGNQNKELYYEEKGYFLIGSAVDCMLTGQEGEFEKQYYVSTLEKKPSDVEMSIVNMVFDELNNNNIPIDLEFSQYENMILLVIDEHGWQKNWKAETRLSKIVEKCSDYFEDLKKSIGKDVLTSENKNLIDTIVMNLKTNSRVSKFFNRESQERNKIVDFYYQLPIYFTYRGIECKALLDLLIVVKNEEGKIIAVHPVDLKTMSGYTLAFIQNLKHHRYDIQAAWYTIAVMHWLEKVFSVTESVVKNFQFVVESTTTPGKPLLFEVTPELLDNGLFGREEVVVKDQIIRHAVKGLKHLLDDYLYYEEQEWIEEKVIYTADLSGNPIKLFWDTKL